MGTVIAWMLVRDTFPGRRLVDAVIDLPFALPTIVAGLTLLTLYGPNGPTPDRHRVHAHRGARVAPFVTRAVRRPDGAARADGARPRDRGGIAARSARAPFTTFRRVVFPVIFPAILSGVALAYARAVGEFGAVVLITGNLPFKTEVLSVYIFGRIESGDPSSAAAVSVLVLAISLAVLLGIGALRRRFTRWEHA